ncbi:MAG: hypothetical protein QNJ55_20120 [Xenococcus sp. MO_188.B8]|nr:hypothetical protein [Xenococcus sp. MO_188.B8]
MFNRILAYLFYPLFLPLKAVLHFCLYKTAKDAHDFLTNDIEEVENVNSEIGQVPVTVRTSKDTELDFIKYRSPTYIKPMTWGVAQELAAMFLKVNKPQPINEEILVRIFTETAAATRTQWDEKRQSYVVDFSCFRAGVWDGYYQDVLEFEFNKEHAHYAIIDRQGNHYTPDHPNWYSCLLHVICSYAIFVPAACHNWIHFAFPDTIATAVNHKLSKDSFLYHLLAPHCRFTNRINHQALWIQRSTDNYPDLRHKLIPWMPYPFYGENFRNGVLYNTAQKYQDIRDHFGIPDQLDTAIPYFAYLKAYFDVINKFIQSITPYIENDVYAILANYMESFFPRFKEIDKTQVLSVFIWQVGIWHLTDHLTYFPYAKEYGFTEIRKPITEPFSLSEVSSYDRYCFRSFLNVFVMFNPNPKLNQSLLNIDAYNFPKDSELYAAAVSFRDNLLEIDRQLKAKNLQFVPIEKHIQSVCF